MVSDKDAKEIFEFEKGRYNPIKQFTNKIKWYHIVLFVLFIGFCVYLIYDDAGKSKFTIVEKAELFNSLRATNMSNETITTMMTKVNQAGKVNIPAVALILAAFLFIIFLILSQSPFQDLTYPLALKIVKKNLELSTGYGKQFPLGTVFKVGPIGKKMRTGTVGLGPMIPYKYVIKIIVRYPSLRYETYLAHIEYPTGAWEGLVPVGKDALDQEFRDVKIVQPRELYLMSASKRGGAPLQWSTNPESSPFYTY